MFIKKLGRKLRKILYMVIGHKAVMYIPKIWSGRVSDRTISHCFQAIASNQAKRTTPMPDVEYLVYYGEKKAESHFDMWNPVFAKLPGKYISVFRFAIPWWPQMDEPDVYPVSILAECEALFARLPNLKAVFYPANNGVNLQAVRNNECQHIFLGHGDSNKASSANKVFRLYDEIWIAGQAHQDRFDLVSGDFSALKFHIIGQPWMQDWLQSRPEVGVEQRKGWGYFPTWSGYYKDSNYSSLHLATMITETAAPYVVQDGSGMIKAHPWTDETAMRALETVATSPLSSVQVMDPESRLRDVLSSPLQFVVCDVSAAVTECLYIDVPIFLYRAPYPVKLRPSFEADHAFCYMFTTASELNALLERVIAEGDDYLADHRRQAIGRLVDLDKTRDGQFYTEINRLQRDVSNSIE